MAVHGCFSGACPAKRSTKFLLGLFQELRPCYHDILHDMEEAEEFLIDGEGLFLEALVDPRHPLAHSGSPVQLVYWAESLMAKLKKRGGRFRLVFFQAHAGVWAGLPQAAALRAVLIAHLRRVLPSEMLVEFPAWWLPPSGTFSGRGDGAGPSGSSPPAGEVGGKAHHGRGMEKEHGQRQSQRPLLDPKEKETPRDSPDKQLPPAPQTFDRFLQDLNPAFVLVSDLLATARHQEPWDAHPQIHLAAQLATAFTLACLRYAPCVFLSKLDFDAITAFGLRASPEGAFRLLSAAWPLVLTCTVDITRHLRTGPCQHGCRRDFQPAPAAAVTSAAVGASVVHVATAATAGASTDSSSRGGPSTGPVDTGAAGAHGATAILTPRAALAARLCAEVLQERHGAFTAALSNTDWLCELYILHAVLMDHLPLKCRALALPYRASSLYGRSVARPTLATRIKAFMARCVLPKLTRDLLSGDCDHAARAAAASSAQGMVATAAAGAGAEAAQAVTSPLPSSSPSLMPGLSWASDPPQGYKAVLTVPTVVPAALVDPYHGTLLHGLAAVLLIMRSLGANGGSDGPQERMAPGKAGLAATAACGLGLGLELSCSVAKVWGAARALAGLPMLVDSHSDSDTVAPTAATQSPSSTAISEAAPHSNVPGQQLIRHLLATMPWDEVADTAVAEALASVLLGPGPQAPAGPSCGSDEAGSSSRPKAEGSLPADGPAAQLDKAAQGALLAAIQLPEALRRHPMVAAVASAWQQLHRSAEMMQPCSEGPEGGLRATQGVDNAASQNLQRWALLQGISLGGGHRGQRLFWGPWASIVQPVLDKPGIAAGGFASGAVEERYHWHTRQLLQPAYITQANDREIRMRLDLKAIRETPKEQLIRRFRCKPWFGRAMRRARRAGQDSVDGGVPQLREAMEEEVINSSNWQKHKEEAANKLLIDSLHGGVTFFRSGGAGGSGGRNGSGNGAVLSGTVVQKLGDIESVEELERIRVDRAGRERLAELLRAERMSLVDLRRRLQSMETDRQASLRRASARQADTLLKELQRWRTAVGEPLSQLASGATTVRINQVLEGLRRFSASAATPAELKAIASAVSIQLFLALLYSLNRQPKPRHPAIATAEPAAKDRHGGGNGGATGVTVTANAAEELSVALGAEVAPLGSLRPFWRGATALAKADGRGGGGVGEPPDGSGNSGGGGGGDWEAALLQPGPSQEALKGLLQALGELKTACKSQRHLWVQPAPLMADPRIGIPALYVAYEVLNCLGLTDTAKCLLSEAGWDDLQQLTAVAKAMESRIKALSSSGQQRAESRGKAAGKDGGKGGVQKGKAVKEEDGASGGADAGDALDGITSDALLREYDKVVASARLKAMRLGVSLVRFQLLCMGDLLVRPAGGAHDPRVGFIPDEWQRRLLDVIDSGASAVVSAPTSSGKTFISSYVVRRVLQLYGGHGRVVMVVPTKALVTQVRAQFAKDFHDVRSLPPGKVVEGAFTRDFRSNALNSVVLVTVPQCLEILMLSPAHRAWVASIKHVIYDEVHCINERDVGEVWERMLLATRCPLLGLSATIGNTQDFTTWLRRVKQVQRARDEALGKLSDSPATYEVHLIEHKERYNDLTSSIYLPSPEQTHTDAADIAVEDGAEVPIGMRTGRGRGDGGGNVERSGVSPALCFAAVHSESRKRSTTSNGDLPEPVQRVATNGAGPGSSHSPVRRCGEVLPLHPLISVNLDRVAATRVLPAELSMTPSEVLQLYDGMVRQVAPVALEAARAGDAALTAAAELAAARLAALDPDVIFAPAVAAADSVEVGAVPAVGGVSACGDGLVVLNDLGDRLGGGSQAAMVKRGNAGSLVSRSQVKAWEALLIKELLAWACAPPLPPPPAANNGATQYGPSRSSGGCGGGVGVTAGISAQVEGARGALPRPGGRAARGDMAGGSCGAAASDVAGGRGDGVDSQHATTIPTANGGGDGLWGPWRECLRRVAAALGSRALQRERAVQEDWSRVRGGDSIYSASFQYTYLVPLVLTLHKQGKLPGIIFNFSRRHVENYASIIVDYLEELQTTYRQRYSGQLAPVIKAYDASTAAARARAGEPDAERDGRKGAASAAQRGTSGAASDDNSMPMRRTHLIDGITFSLDPLRPDPSFSLVPFSRMDDQRLIDTLDELRGSPHVQCHLIRALEFGVGVHHSGLNKKYRQAVEMLFRAQVLQVIIATGTLAYGIHMPCRSVVLAGDSPHLDALNFRQMSGRSGRRGLDTLGNVVFFGVPSYRIHRLRSSPLPRLRGQMPVTPATTLRLLLLSEKLTDAAAAVSTHQSQRQQQPSQQPRQQNDPPQKGGGRAVSGVRSSASSGSDGHRQGPAANEAAAHASFANDLAATIVLEPFLATSEGVTRVSAISTKSGTSTVTKTRTAGIGAAAAGPPVPSSPNPLWAEGGSGVDEGKAIKRDHGTLVAAAAATTSECASSDAVRLHMRHMLDMSLVTLLRNRMFDPACGRMSGLAGMAAHLFWTEPANFVLCRLLHEGVFVRMCAELRGQALKDSAVNLLAHLFERLPLSSGLARKVEQGHFAGRSSSIVRLRPMSRDAARCIKEYNREAFSIVVGSVINFVLAQQEGQRQLRRLRTDDERQGALPIAAADDDDDFDLAEATLPLSGTVIAPAKSYVFVQAQPPLDAQVAGVTESVETEHIGAETDDGRNGAKGGNRGAEHCSDEPQGLSGGWRSLAGLLHRMCRHLVACSPFMALGGEGDDFASVSDLLIAVRQCVMLQASAIPVLELPNRRGVSMPLNAWMYDFFKHKSLQPLLQDNQIHTGEYWDKMASAKGILNAIALALELAAEEATASANGEGHKDDDAVDRQEESAARLNELSEVRDEHALAQLEAELEELQHLPAPTVAQRCTTVARLFRIVALEFSKAIRGVGT